MELFQLYTEREYYFIPYKLERDNIYYFVTRSIEFDWSPVATNSFDDWDILKTKTSYNKLSQKLKYILIEQIMELQEGWRP